MFLVLLNIEQNQTILLYTLNSHQLYKQYVCLDNILLKLKTVYDNIFMSKLLCLRGFERSLTCFPLNQYQAVQLLYTRHENWNQEKKVSQFILKFFFF